MAPKFQKKPPVIYKSRKVDFLGEGRLVLHPQDAEGHCLLLALGNALLLNGSISLSPDLVRDDVPQEHLQLRLHMYYKKLYKEKLLAKDPAVIEDEMMPTIKCLSGPVDISINFMRNDGIKSRTVSLNIFDHMNIKIYHGWMISSEDVPISEIVGSSFHDVIRVDNPDPSTLIQNAGEDFKIFFAGPDLTTLGFQLLTESLENDSVCVLFWKRSFHTMVKLNDGLFVLQNDFNFLNTDIVWKELKSVRDDGRFCTASFQLIKHKCPSVKCQLEFISVMNLKRHNKGHLKRCNDNIALKKKMILVNFGIS